MVAGLLLASILGLFALAMAVAVPESSSAGSNAAALQVAVEVTTTSPAEGRGHMKNMALNPYMLIPQLIALGFAPIVLANLKMMVMSALMINNMALNAAIFMTIRNMVFGPRPKVKYVNHGYHEHQNQHYHNHRQEDGDYHHHHHDDGGHSNPARSTEHHASPEETQTADRRKRTAATIASLRQ